VLVAQLDDSIPPKRCSPTTLATLATKLLGACSSRIVWPLVDNFEQNAKQMYVSNTPLRGRNTANNHSGWSTIMKNPSSEC
jgi:hypothetical protein